MIHPYSRRSTRRVSITVPFTVHERVSAMADEQGRSISNLMAYLVECALDRLGASHPG